MTPTQKATSVLEWKWNFPIQETAFQKEWEKSKHEKYDLHENNNEAFT